MTKGEMIIFFFVQNTKLRNIQKKERFFFICLLYVSTQTILTVKASENILRKGKMLVIRMKG